MLAPQTPVKNDHIYPNFKNYCYISEINLGRKHCAPTISGDLSVGAQALRPKPPEKTTIFIRQCFAPTFFPDLRYKIGLK